MRFVLIASLCLLAACTSRTDAPIVPQALSIGDLRKVYVGTTRAFEEGVYGFGRSEDLTLLDVTVSLPPGREVGEISYGGANPDPRKDFALAQMTRHDTPRSFRAALARDIRQSPGLYGRDVTIYVHGYNNSFTDSTFRLAQLAVDTGLSGPVVSYAWPSLGNPLGYEYDADSAMFARDGLAQLLREVMASGARRIVVVAHSMGGRLVMEVLRQMEIAEPGWSARNTAGILLMSPDVNVDVFRAQATHFQTWPQPFVVFKSQDDRALLLSASLRGEDVRLGNLRSLDPVSDLPVLFIDVTEFDDGDLGNHFVAGSSAAFLRLVRAARQTDDRFLTGDSHMNLSLLGEPHSVGRALLVAPMAGRR